jgi:hypothetical protein
LRVILLKFKTGELHNMLCGAIDFKFMERKESLVYIGILKEFFGVSS